MAAHSPDTDSLDARRRRLRYRASHRGTKELDLILGGYVDAHVEGLDEKAIKRLETLLEHEETELQHWLMGENPVADGVDRELLEKIKTFQRQRASAMRKEHKP